MRIKWFPIVILLTMLIAACASGSQTTPTGEAPASPMPTAPVPGGSPTAAAPAVTQPAGTQTLRVMTHDSFDVSPEVVTAFEQQFNARIQFLKSGDTGTALNKAILSKASPLADVFYGVDNTFLSRALEEDIFEAYPSPLLEAIPDVFELDGQQRTLPVDYGDVCLNYDKQYLKDNSLQPPQNLEDLLKPEYKSLLVVENPATSSPGLAFLLATIGHFGPDNYLDYWDGLVQNDLLVVNDWETAYYTEFSRSGGTRPVVVSYDSSPAFEVIYASQPMEEAPTGVVTGGESCFRQIEFVGILKGTPNRDLAEKWVDFMLSPAFQNDLPLKMFVFPVNQNAQIDPQLAEHLVVPDQTAHVSPEDIAANREQWIQDWTNRVIRR